MKYHKRKKAAVVGSGFVGSACAHWLAARQSADTALIDKNKGMAKGRALDLQQAAVLNGSDLVIEGGSDYSLAAGSDIVIITAGFSRKPGMTREDLLHKNSAIMREVCGKLKDKGLNESAFFIIVSNPLDAMVYLAHQELQPIPRERIVGMAGVLDSARFKTFIAQELKVSAEDVSAVTLGGHGDAMLPLTRTATVGGLPLEALLSREALERIVQRTRQGGGEIVGLMKTGSAFYAPALSAVQTAEAVLFDKRRVLPSAALLQGEYGERDIFVGVPCLFSGGGMEKIIEISFTEEESEQFKKSVASVRESVSLLD